MKLKKTIIQIAGLLLTATLIFTACKKNEQETPEEANIVEDGQTSLDNRTAQGSNDLVLTDINNEMANNTLLHGKTSSAFTGLSGFASYYTVDTNGAYLGTINLVYNGQTINNITKTGYIKLSIVNYASGKRWKQVGCAVKIDYVGYKVARSSDLKSIELNGVQFLTNESGGTLADLVIFQSQTNLITTVTGSNLSVKFEDGKTATYNINRRFTYTYPNTILTCKGEGIGVFNNLNHLENYGINRAGIAFTSQVVSPVIWNMTCGPNAPIQGQMSVKASDREYTVNVFFSVDASGNTVIPGPNNCPYGWKIEWPNKSQTGKKVFPYS